MKSFKVFLLTASLLLGTGILASAQTRDWGHDRDRREGWQDRDNDRDRDWDRDRDRDWDRSNQRAYRDGLKDGEKDARKGRHNHYNNRYRDNGDRRAYEYGYRRGSRQGGYYGNNNGYPNNGYPNQYPNNGYPDQYPNNGSNHPFGGVLGQQGNRGGLDIASQNGYSDGYLAGQKDRSTGHSFRPQENKGYKDADRGQSSSGISSRQFKQAYRDAFINGYQRGYNGR